MKDLKLIELGLFVCCFCCVFPALVDPSMAAPVKGTTAALCQPVSPGGEGTAGFKDAHCKEVATGSAVKFEHVGVAQAQTTEITATNITTGSERSFAVLHSVQPKEVLMEIVAKRVEGVGWLTNSAAENGEHYVHGELVLEYSEMEVQKPAGKGCKVKAASAVTNHLLVTSQGQGMGLKMEAADGDALTELTVEGCSTTSLNGPYDIKGSLISAVEGATVSNTSEGVTSQGTVTVRGQKGGLAGSLTLKGRLKTSEAYEPLAATTWETEEISPDPDGTTAFTCKAASGGEGVHGFKDSDCKQEATGTSVQYEHAEIPSAATTELSTSNLRSGGERASAFLESVQSGILEKIVAGQVEGTGTLANSLDAGGEHYVSGEGKLEFGELEITRPAEKGCKVKGGAIVSKQLKATTTAQGMFVRAEPAAGTIFAEFEVEACSVTALNGLYKVEGSLKVPVTGATLTPTTEAVTAQGTLKTRGQKSGFGTALTISGRANSGESYVPVAGTTVDTQEPVGTTAFTCGPEGQPNSKAGFSNAHCKPGDAVGTNAAYVHTEVPAGTSTEVSGSNKKTGAGTEATTPMKLSATISGVETEIQAAGVSASGSLENMKDAASTEHTISGTGSVTFTGVTVAKPEGKGCKVKTGEVKSKELKATTAGQEDAVKFEPASGTLLASFEVEGCSTESLNGLYEVNGSIKGAPEGATSNFSESTTTAQSTLTVRGVKGGLDGSLTIAGRVKGSGSNYTDLSSTTIQTE